MKRIEASLSEPAIDPIANGAPHVSFIKLVGAFNTKGEVIAEIQERGRSELRLGGLAVGEPGEIHVLRGTSPVIQTEVKSKPAFEHPGVRGMFDEACESSLECDDSPQPGSSPRRSVWPGRQTLAQRLTEHCARFITHDAK